MSDSVEAHLERQRLTAIDALGRGQAALAASDLVAARRWLDRANRVAGGNDTITLLLAGVDLRRGDPAAADAFAVLAERHDLRDAWIGLAVAAHRAGDAVRAAAALRQLFGGHVQANPDTLRPLADAVAAAAGAAGWCCLDGDHALVVGPARMAVALTLDGRPLRTWPRRLPSAGSLEVRSDRGALLGSPLQLGRIGRLDGCVTVADDGEVAGWAWHPNDPGRPPALRAIAADGAVRSIMVAAPDTVSPRDADARARPFAQPRSFRLVADAHTGGGPVRVVGPEGRDLPGSPVDPLASRRYAASVTTAVAGRGQARADALLQAPVPAALRGVFSAPATGAPRRVSVVVPVYRGVQATLACLDSLFAGGSDVSGVPPRIIVVDDAGPEPALAAALDRLAAAGRLTLIRHARNHGFPAAANTGMRAAGRDDVVLLNADTLVPPGWLAALQAACRSAPDVGTATPLSNDATLLSYPRAGGGNDIPTLAATRALHRLAARANGTAAIEIPTAIGFCMYIRRDCIDQIGLLRQDVFAQGYAEENDFCMRARHLGWRHVAAAGVFVGHVGGQSFGAARAPLLVRNLAALNRLHPGYDALIAADEAGPALAHARRRIDLARLAARPRLPPAVILITHDMGGGVERQVQARCDAIRAAGETPVVLRPVLARPLLQGTGKCTVGLAPDLPNLVYHVTDELAGLLRLLTRLRPRRVELHHTLGHHQAITGLAALLRVPYEVHLHDYAWFCPRISLVGFERRYCGEPDIAGCEACIADAGRATDDPTPVPQLVARSAAELAGAERVIAPSTDTAGRIARHFPGIRAELRPWDDSRPQPSRRPGRGTPRVVGILGAIGIEKGYDVLLACARDAAARALPLRFVVVGHSTDDARLLDTGAVFVTGEYKPDDLPRLIAAEDVTLGFLPSIWPETWCFTLSEAWRAGLSVVAFDIGAPAERIRRHGGGTLLPLGLRPASINMALLGVGE